MIKLDLIDLCRQLAAQIIKINKTSEKFSKLMKGSMEKGITLMKHILTDACHHLRPYSESSKLSFKELWKNDGTHFGPHCSK